jgi:hypothetical protein
VLHRCGGLIETSDNGHDRHRRGGHKYFVAGRSRASLVPLCVWIDAERGVAAAHETSLEARCSKPGRWDSCGYLFVPCFTVRALDGLRFR